MLLRMMRARAGDGKASAPGGVEKPLFLALAALFVLLALIRPVDHDESQYVAAALLAQTGQPYRDFPYFQTPLQPLLFGPLTQMFGVLAWPGLRIVNALLGAGTVALVVRAARGAGAEARVALAAGAAFACTDILLFGAGVARNDALPAFLFAGAIVIAVEAAGGRGTPTRAALAGLLLAAAAAAKVSYALPAITCFGWALFDRRHRPALIALGAAPVVLLVLWLAMQAPEAFRFEVLTFPSIGPEQYYRDAGRAMKLSPGLKVVDTFKFLALGTALPAIVAVGARWRRGAAAGPVPMLAALALAGLVAALLPQPTWRQYLLPALPPLFVALALAWTALPPARCERIAVVVFACAGLAPSVESVVLAARHGAPMAVAVEDGAMIAGEMNRMGVTGRVATLSPQYLAATGRLPDPRFAAGPFYFRSHGLLDPAAERAMGLVSAGNVGAIDWPQAALVGGEALTTGGDVAAERRLAGAASGRALQISRMNGGRFTLYVLQAPAPVSGTAME